MKTMNKDSSKASRLRRGSGVVLVLFAIFGSSRMWAQNEIGAPSAAVEAPSGPLVASAPAFSQWVVTFSYPEDKNNSSVSAPAPPPAYLKTQTRLITTTRTDNITHEEIKDGSGAEFDEWHVGPVIYSKDSTSSVWGEIDSTSDSRNGSPTFAPLPPGGFRDLNWISVNDYLGTIKYGGRDCLVFAAGRESIHSSPEDALKNPASFRSIAIIDAQSRLPVQVMMGGIIRIFQFRQPPTEKLSLPPDLADQLKKGEEGRQLLNRPMERPY
jgi:hypothetical protein